MASAEVQAIPPDETVVSFADKYAATTPHIESTSLPGGLSDLEPGTDEDGKLMPPKLHAISNEVIIEWVRETKFGTDPANPDRTRLTGLAEVDGREYLVRWSKAHDEHADTATPTPADAHGPGLLEMIDAKWSSSKTVHDNLALSSPDRHTISIAPAWYSRHGRAPSLREALFDNKFEDYARAFRRIVASIVEENAEVTLIPVSMNKVIAYKLAAQNMGLLQEHHERLNIHQIIPVVGCLVGSKLHEDEGEKATPFRTTSDAVERVITTLSFGIHVPLNIAGESLRNPLGAARNAIGAAVVAETIVRQPTKGIAAAKHLINILPGIPFRKIKEVGDAHHVHDVGGDKDPMYKKAQAKRLRELHPEKQTEEIHTGRGHMLPMDEKATVDAINRGRRPRATAKA